MKNMTLKQFLAALATAYGDEYIDLIDDFQSGALTVEGISADEAKEL
tara:strand:+ start:4407 stop:4547 length:141 start_codon:yes stop_codon:yes gene_type:complete